MGAVHLAATLGERAPNRAAPEHILTLDRPTQERLTTCSVTLRRGPAHVGVWLRLLRTLPGFGPLSN